MNKRKLVTLMPIKNDISSIPTVTKCCHIIIENKTNMNEGNKFGTEIICALTLSPLEVVSY
jgi:hypothetical protein